MFGLVSNELTWDSFLTLFLVSLGVIILVCSIFTPIIAYYYKFRFKKTKMHLKELEKQKLKSETE